MDLFTKKEFKIFQVDGLDERMALIRERIQPIFQLIGETYIEEINEYTGFDGSFHIAQHRRRTAYAPESTWSAFGGNKRGYKKYPHLQVGINSDHVFIFLSIIDNPVYEKEMGQLLLDKSEQWKRLPEDMYISGDHTKEIVQPFSEEVVTDTLNRLLSVKKAEFMIGRIIPHDSELLNKQDKQKAFFTDTISDLLPLYKQLLDEHVYQDSQNKG